MGIRTAQVVILCTMLLGLSSIGSALMARWAIDPYGQSFDYFAQSFKRVIRTSLNAYHSQGIVASVKALASGSREVSNANSETLIGGHHIINKTSFDLSEYLTRYELSFTAPGHLASVSESELLIAGATGLIFLFDKSSGQMTTLETNLPDFVLNRPKKMFDPLGEDLTSRLSVRDVQFDSVNGRVYVSYFKFLEAMNCYAISIAVAETSESIAFSEPLNFRNFFTPNFCNPDQSYAAGGRILLSDNNVYFSVGGYDSEEVEDYQDWQREVSALLKINELGEAVAVAKGLRNPLGLTQAQGHLFIADNGPMGGDFFVKITSDQNFGWPVYSYGYSYAYKDIYVRPRGLPEAEPDFYFVPSIGVSQLAFYEGQHFTRFRDKFLLASMKAGKLFVIDYDFSQSAVRSTESYSINSRLRDLIVDQTGHIWLLSDSAQLILLERSNADMPDRSE